MHPGDMRAQVNQALDDPETVLRKAGMDFSNIVRLNEYTTDMEAWFAVHDVLDTRLANCQFASTLSGVTRLAIPELLVELEATAVS